MEHNVGRELLDVPFPEMITSMASAIAWSQAALDRESISILKIMGDKEKAPVHLPKLKVGGGEDLIDDDNDDFVTSMIGAGFQPTFYQFAETIIEVKMTIKVTDFKKEDGEKATGYKRTKSSLFFGAIWCVTATPLTATYTNLYNYNVEGHSLLRTRLVPVPPNTFIQRLLDMKAQSMQAAFQVELKQVELEIARQQKIADIEAKVYEESFDL
jgi:hypothetical protein